MRANAGVFRHFAFAAEFAFEVDAEVLRFCVCGSLDLQDDPITFAFRKGCPGHKAISRFVEIQLRFSRRGLRDRGNQLLTGRQRLHVFAEKRDPRFSVGLNEELGVSSGHFNDATAVRPGSDFAVLMCVLRQGG